MDECERVWMRSVVFVVVEVEVEWCGERVREDRVEGGGENGVGCGVVWSQVNERG